MTRVTTYGDRHHDHWRLVDNRRVIASGSLWRIAIAVVRWAFRRETGDMGR